MVPFVTSLFYLVVESDRDLSLAFLVKELCEFSSQNLQFSYGAFPVVLFGVEVRYYRVVFVDEGQGFFVSCPRLDIFDNSHTFGDDLGRPANIDGLPTVPNTLVSLDNCDFVAVPCEPPGCCWPRNAEATD
jgi:hypothetical protein